MFTFFAWLVAGCSCKPTLPPTDDQTEETHETAHTAAESAHSAIPQGQCTQPEIEPNDGFDEGQPLVLERGACGVIDEVGDQDFWSFELEQDSWLLVEALTANGAVTNPSVLVTPAEGGWAAGRADDPEDPSVHLRFPAPAGEYVVGVSEQSFLGGDRYGYDLLVSEAKPPVSWDRSEVEPNDNNLTAEVATAGERVFGTLDGNGALPDFDWYQVVVPTGKHTVSFEVVAYDEGSPADVSIFLWDGALQPLPEGCREVCSPTQPACVECEFEGGVEGLELDPFGEYASDGNELLWIQLAEGLNRDSPSNWYVLTVTVEGS